MRLRNRAKDNIQTNNEENDEDVDDPDEPDDDSDCDPEWEVPEESDGNFSSKKRKVFMPIPKQMQQQLPTKIQIIEEPISNKTSTPAVSSGTPIIKSAKKIERLSSQDFVFSSAQEDKDISIDYDEEIERNDLISENELMTELGVKDINHANNTTIKTIPDGTTSGTKKVIVITPSSSTTVTPPKKDHSTLVVSPLAPDRSRVVRLTNTLTSGTTAGKIIKSESNHLINFSTSSSSTSFSAGDFIKDVTKNDPSVWQVDAMNLLQKYLPVKTNANGEEIEMEELGEGENIEDLTYKSTYTYDGLNAMNSSRFHKVDVTIVNKVKSKTYIKINKNPLKLNKKVKLENKIVNEKIEDQTGGDKQTTVIQKPKHHTAVPIKRETPTSSNDNFNYEERVKNYKNTFKDNITIFLQALISQCIDKDFLQAIYNDNDDYFLENIKAIDVVYEGKKMSLRTLPNFPNNEKILYAVHTYPVLNIKQIDENHIGKLYCIICNKHEERNKDCKSNLICLEVSGSPYDKHTLIHVQLLVENIEKKYKLLLVCSTCSQLLQLYSAMCHSKYLIYRQCQVSVQEIITRSQSDSTSAIIEPADVIPTLLDNPTWFNTKLLQIIKDWIRVDELKKNMT